MSTGDNVKKAGQYCMIAGGVTLFIMAASAAVILDIVFIAVLCKQANQASQQDNRNPVGAGINFAMTYSLWNLISKNTHPLVLVLLSPLVSLAAAVLAVALDVSYIAWWIGGGWAVGAGLLLLGYTLYKLGQYLNQDKPQLIPVDENEGYVSRIMRNWGLFQERIDVLPWATATLVSADHLPTADAVYCQS